jgi:hypothetical protein
MTVELSKQTELALNTPVVVLSNKLNQSPISSQVPCHLIISHHHMHFLRQVTIPSTVLYMNTWR